MISDTGQDKEKSKSFLSMSNYKILFSKHQKCSKAENAGHLVKQKIKNMSTDEVIVMITADVVTSCLYKMATSKESSETLTYHTAENVCRIYVRKFMIS
jgi:hypothetical protein